MNTSAPSVYRYLPSELADRLRDMSITVTRSVEGPGQGAHHSPHFGSSVEFAEYREYTPGDPPNRIDWAVFARSDRYMVRRFQEETNLRAYILLDTSESQAFKEYGARSKMECGCSLAAGLMFMLVNQGDSVGLMTFDDEIRETYPPVGTMEGLRRLLVGLEHIKPAGRSNIENAIHAAANQIHARSLVIVISDLLQAPEAVLRGIRHLSHDRHAILVLHVMDFAEMQLSAGGLAEFRELETGARMIVHTDELRQAYAREVQSFIEELRRGCAGCMATYHLVDTRVAPEETLFGKLTRV
jgi:uncharacterized protein (DUF58 family)